jgi:hypothetical protein
MIRPIKAYSCIPKVTLRRGDVVLHICLTAQNEALEGKGVVKGPRRSLRYHMSPYK